MKKTTLFARAKINLALDVLGKFENGYHNINTIMQTVNITDSITISPASHNNINLSSNLFWLPKDHRNLVFRAASFLKQNFNISSGIDIYLKKKIPVSAGLAGGSTDCATTLIGIRNLFKLPISNKELFNISKQFGADVPFCLSRGTYLAQGIGDILTPLPPMPFCYIVVAKPNINVSTKMVFSNLDLSNISSRPDIDKIIFYLEKKDLKNICLSFSNVLEYVTINKFPIISDIKNSMIHCGALGSLMSGSGSSVFGIFTSKNSALNALKYIKSKYHFNEIFLTTPFNNYS